MMRTVRSRKAGVCRGMVAALSVLALVAGARGQSMPTTMPTGHPVVEPGAIPAGTGTMPTGHLMLDQMGMTGATMPATLPAGHPAIGTSMGGGGGGSMMGGGPLGGMGMPSDNLNGTLNITVVGGSAGGTSVANEAVTVELFSQQGQPVKKTEYKTDGLGKLTVPNIPLMPPVDVVVSIHHAGLVQQAEGPALTLDAPAQSVEMKVYDPTDEKPAWTVAMQHMIVEWAKDGSAALVTEMLSTNNPADRAWLGAKEGDKRVTLVLTLPPDADHIALGGSFDEDKTDLVAGKLVTGSALFPGRSEFRLSYSVPAKSGAVELPIVAPAAVGNLIVFVPADETEVTATGLTGGKAVDMGQGAVRMYQAQNLEAGATARIAVKGIKAAAAEEAGAAGGGFSARNVAVGGAFLLVLAGAALMLMKKPQGKKA